MDLGETKGKTFGNSYRFLLRTERQSESELDELQESSSERKKQMLGSCLR